MAFDKFLRKTEGTVSGLSIAKGEDASLPCYFTPHFFAVETNDGLFVSNQALTLRQIIALLEEKSYNYSELKVHYSLIEITATEELREEVVAEKAEPKLKSHKKHNRK